MIRERRTIGKRAPSRPGPELRSHRLAAALAPLLALGSVVVALTAPLQAQTVGADGPCVADDFTLCLTAGRFEVTATFTSPGAIPAPAHAAPLVADTGTFWFFDPDNIEVVVKVLDACSFADRFWVFAGGLTNVEVELSVRDTASGQSRTYRNPAGHGLPAGPGHRRVRHLRRAPDPVADRGRERPARDTGAARGDPAELSGAVGDAAAGELCVERPARAAGGRRTEPDLGGAAPSHPDRDHLLGHRRRRTYRVGLGGGDCGGARPVTTARALSPQTTGGRSHAARPTRRAPTAARPSPGRPGADAGSGRWSG